MRLTSLWEPYGLRGSPFFQDELSPTSSDHPVSLFIGREQERERIIRRLVSDAKSRTIIQGDPGVGKTSFVNRLKADAAENGIVSYEHPIRITSGTTLTSFLADSLRTILRMRSSSGRAVDDPFWKRTAQMLEGAELVGGSASAFGFGAGVSRSYMAPQMPPDALFEHLGEALVRINEEVGGPVLLHVNNLENLSGGETETAAQLILDLRDYLQLKGAHWIFVGPRGIEGAVFRVHRQVSGIFPEAETLEPLESRDIMQLLSLRYDHLASPGMIPAHPIRPEDGARLYSMYGGDLRNFLRLLSDAGERVLGLGGVRPMEIPDVLRAVQPLYQAGLKERLGETDFSHLVKLSGTNRETIPEFRVSEAKQLLEVTQPGASQVIGRLYSSGAITIVRKVGKSTYYSPTGSALIALGLASGAVVDKLSGRA